MKYNPDHYAYDKAGNARCNWPGIAVERHSRKAGCAGMR